jgi:tRNA(adenine34) deaminase
MRLAIEAAETAAGNGEVPVGAVISRGGEVVAVAGNSIEGEGDPTMHAEIAVIRKAAKALGSKWLTGCTLYVTVEPCAMCAGAAVLARLDRIVAGAVSDKSGACGSVLDILESEKLNHRIDYSAGLLEKECAALLSGFFEGLRRNGDSGQERY